MSDKTNKKVKEEELPMALPEEMLTPEELKTGEVKVEGVPENFDLEKHITQLLALHVIAVGKQSKKEKRALKNSEFYQLTTALGIVKKSENTSKEPKVTKELRSLDVDELKVLRENVKKANEAKSKGH